MARTPLQGILQAEGRKQSWLAEQVGIDQAHMSRIVNGLHPTDATALKLAKALNRPVDELFPATYLSST